LATTAATQRWPPRCWPETAAKASANPYDWLGNGIYFWEHGPQRAYEWAIEQTRLSGRKVKASSVLGAKINLGVCLDLLDTANTQLLGEWYVELRRFMQRNGIADAAQRDARAVVVATRCYGFRDCAVMDFALKGMARTSGYQIPDSESVFVEGLPAFPGAKIALKSHIQIAVRDPGCVTEFFRPDLLTTRQTADFSLGHRSVVLSFPLPVHDSALTRRSNPSCGVISFTRSSARS